MIDLPLTDRSRKVLTLAESEARLLGHEHVGTEHILLGMIKEGEGLAGKVLIDFGLSLTATRLEVEKFVKRGTDAGLPEVLPWTPRVESLLGLAMEEVRNLEHLFIGTEHLLLGLLRDPESVAVRVLTNVGLESEEIRSEVLSILGHDLFP